MDLFRKSYPPLTPNSAPSSRARQTARHELPFSHRPQDEVASRRYMLGASRATALVAYYCLTHHSQHAALDTAL